MLTTSGSDTLQSNKALKSGIASTKNRNHGNYFIYDRAPNRVERLEMIYRYGILQIVDLSESNTIGNSKSTDSAERVSIEPTRREVSRTCSDLLRTQLDISIGEQSETSQPCQRPWLPASLFSGFWPYGK